MTTSDRPRWAVILVIAAAVVGVMAGCAREDRDRTAAPAAPAAPKQPTEASAIAAINASCRAFLAGDAKLTRDATGAIEIRTYASARLRLVEDAKASLDSTGFPASMSGLRRQIEQLLDAALALYRQAVEADDEQLSGLRSQAEDLIRQSAVLLLKAGAQDCVPTSRAPGEAVVAADAGELLPRDPVATISLGPPGIDNNRIVADEHMVWVGLKNLHQLVRIDPATNAVVATVDLGGPPSGAPQIVDGSVWIDTPQQVLRINGATNTIDRRFDRGALGYGDDFTVEFSRDELFGCSGGVLRVVSPVDGTLIRSVTLSVGCVGIETDGASYWVSSPGDSSLVRVDPQTGAVLAKVDRDGLAGPTIDGDTVWTRNDHEVFRFDASTGALKSTASRSQLDVLQLSVGGGGYWIASSSNRRVIRVDATTMDILELNAGEGVNAVAYSNGTLWAANSDAGTVMRFDVHDLGGA